MHFIILTVIPCLCMKSNKSVEMKGVVVLILFLAYLCTSQAEDFGEPCNDLKPCRYLKCIDGMCQCNVTTSIYSQLKNKCFALAGQPCEFNENCTENSHCIWGRCSCNPGYNVTDTYTCNSLINAPCAHDTHCNFNNHYLICMDGHCLCDPKVSKHEVPEVQSGAFLEEGKCVGRPGHPCVEGSCVSGALCIRKQLDYTGWLAGDDGKLVCDCGENYLPSEFGACLKKPGIPCSGHNECYPGLMCRDQKCTCAHSFQTFSNAHLRCKSYVGEPCDSAEDCIVNATCSSIGLCLCKKPQIGTRIEENVTNCIAEHGRHCRKITCACPYDGQVYSEKNNVCMSPAHGDCDGEAECAENSECKKSSEHRHKYHLINGFVGKCLCRDGYEINNHGECRVPFQGMCNETFECDRDLHCVENKCQCEFSRDYTGIYNRKSKKCLLLVGSRCGEPTDYPCVNNADCSWKHWSDDYKTCICDTASNKFRLTGQKTCKRLIRAGDECNENTVCVENAFCQHRNETGESRCKCKQGYEVKSNGECRKPYWGLCIRRKQCNVDLTCGDGRCRCKGALEDTTFNFTSRQCELLVGARCGSDLEYSCVENAECMLESVYSSFPTCSCDANRYDVTERRTCKEVKTVKGIFYRTVSYLYDLVHAKSKK